MKYNKFTNEVRLQVQTIKDLEAKKNFLIDFLKETTNVQYIKIREKIKSTKSLIDLEYIMFNMQLKSEKLGVI